jgi:uncharacterized protein YcfL
MDFLEKEEAKMKKYHLTSFIILLLLSCASLQESPSFDLIESINKDSSISAEVKNKIISKIVENDKEIVTSIMQKNEDLKSNIERNSWKVNLVDTIKSAILWALSILTLAFVGYMVFKFRKFFGSPI